MVRCWRVRKGSAGSHEQYTLFWRSKTPRFRASPANSVGRQRMGSLQFRRWQACEMRQAAARQEREHPHPNQGRASGVRCRAWLGEASRTGTGVRRQGRAGRIRAAPAGPGRGRGARTGRGRPRATTRPASVPSVHRVYPRLRGPPSPSDAPRAATALVRSPVDRCSPWPPPAGTGAGPSGN